MNRLIYLLLVLTCALSAQSTQAQTLDSGYAPNVGGGQIEAMGIQADGKIVIGGLFTTVNGTARNRIARLNVDGSLDSGFDPGTGADSNVYALAVQPDGRILIGGIFTAVNGTSRNGIARLNSDGSLDTSFNPGSGLNGSPSSILVQADARIVLGGGFTSVGGTPRNCVARLNANGSLDAGFDPGSGANDSIEAVAFAPNGKVLIGGRFTTVNGVGRNRIARLNPNGSLDTGFNAGAAINDWVMAINVQSDGNILVGGTFANRIARLDANGSVDPFFSLLAGANGSVQSITAQADGKIIVGGGFTIFNSVGRNRVARLNPNGSLDSGFDPGTGANAVIDEIVVQEDGKIVVGGALLSFNGAARNRIARLYNNGGLESGFSPGSGANGWVATTAIQVDGKILIGGQFTTVNGVSRNNIARLNIDGSLDNTFNVGTGTSVEVYAIVLQSDGKVVIGGNFTSYNGVARNYVARLNTNGSLDTAFDPGAGPNGGVYCVAVQPDGKAVIGGGFTSVAGVGRNFVARLNPDGSHDSSFNPGTGANSEVGSVTLQPDGKILIAGNFTTIAGNPRSRIARLQTDGSLDSGFNVGAGPNNAVHAVSLLADGKIVIGGYFNTIDGVARNYVARLDSNGGLDGSFDPGAGANSWLWTATVQADGKVLIGGDFTTVNGVSRNRIARLNTNGSLDTSFDPGAGANNSVYSLSLQPDGKIVVSGWFTSIMGLSLNMFARLSNTGAALQRIDLSGGTAMWTLGGTMPMSSRVRFETSVDGTLFSNAGSASWSGASWQLSGLSIPSGWNWIRAEGTVSTGVRDGSSYTVIFVQAFFVTTSQAPSVGLVSAPVAYNENDPAVPLDASATVSDVDSADFDTGALSVVFTVNGAAEDSLLVSTTGSVRRIGNDIEYDATGVFGGGQVTIGTLPATGPGSGISGQSLIVTFNANCTPTIAQATLRALAYANSSDNPSTLTRTVRVTVSDGDGGTSNQPSCFVTINAVNDAPTLSIVSTLAGGTEDTQYVISSAGLASAANEADVDSPTINFRIDAISSGTLTINGGAVTAGTTIVTSADQLEWTPAPNANGNLAAFTVVAHDGALASSPTVQVTVSVAAVNDAPLISLPSPQTTPANTALTLSGALAALMSDADAGSATVELAVTVTNGTATLPSMAGLTLTAGANSSSALTVQGTLASINAALNGLLFTPPNGFTGAASLRFDANDLGNTGGAPQTSNATLSITVGGGSIGGGGGGGGGDDDGGCGTGEGNNAFLSLAGLVAALALTRRLRKRVR